MNNKTFKTITLILLAIIFVLLCTCVTELDKTDSYIRCVEHANALGLECTR